MRCIPQIQNVTLKGLASLNAALDGSTHLVQFLPVQDFGRDSLQEFIDVVKGRVKNELAANRGLAGSRHPQLEHESVSGCRGQLEGLFFLDAVTISEHRHMRETMLAVECGHGALGHCPQKERLHLRTCAVDLVEEERSEALPVTKKRPRFYARLTLSIDVRVIDQIARHQIYRAFDAFEIATDRTCKSPQNSRLPNAHIAFEKDMSPCKYRHVDQPDCGLLADDGF